MNILACYEIAFSNQVGKITGHFFVNVPKLTQEALHEIASELLADAKAQGHQCQNLVWRSITRLDSDEAPVDTPAPSVG